MAVTYLLNWPLQPFSQDYGLASPNTHVGCFNLYVSGGAYSITSTVSDRFLRNFFMADIFTINLLTGNRRRYILFFAFNFDAEGLGLQYNVDSE